MTTTGPSDDAGQVFDTSNVEGSVRDIAYVNNSISSPLRGCVGVSATQ
jgi:hypothetical protein